MRSRRKSRLTSDDLQPLQLMQLECGFSPRSFTSEAKERAAWERHRDKIMRDFKVPGRRPYAWWKYEAKRPKPSTWYSEIAALLDLAALPAEELDRIERENPALDPATAIERWSVLYDPPSSSKQPPLLPSVAELEFYSAWHFIRQRAEERKEVIQHFERLIAILRRSRTTIQERT